MWILWFNQSSASGQGTAMPVARVQLCQQLEHSCACGHRIVREYIYELEGGAVLQGGHLWSEHSEGVHLYA
jgi:hypothetical protein